MENVLVKAKMKQIMVLLSSGDKTFTEIGDSTKFWPTSLTTYLADLKKGGYIKRKVAGKRIVYSISKDTPKLSLIWDLIELQEKNALYSHDEANSYFEYGLRADFARLPNKEPYYAPETTRILERAFMKGIAEAIKTGDLPLKPAEGKLLVAFQLDWAEFVKAYKAKGNGIIPYKPTRRQIEEAKAIIRAGKPSGK